MRLESILNGAIGIVGGYTGIGIGYLFGNLIDYVPLANKIAPVIAEYIGFQHDSSINENVYQLLFGAAAFYVGINLIPTLRRISEEDL